MPELPNIDNARAALQPYMAEYARDRYKLRCRELARYIGHEVDLDPPIKLDVGHALTLLNKDSNLGLDDKDSKLLTLTLDVLAMNAKRFGGTTEIESKKGENSTTHAMMSVLLSDRVFEAAGIVKPGETEQLKRMGALGVLIHDAGEALGEFSTNDQQFKGGSAAKEQAAFVKNEAEYYVLNYAMTKAAEALDSGTDKALKNFYKDMSKMRDKLGIIDKNGIPTGNPIDLDFVKRTLDLSSAQLSPEWAEKRDVWMGVWHLAEYGHIDAIKTSDRYAQDNIYRDRIDEISARLEGFMPILEKNNLTVEDRGFYTAYVKNIDKMQGTRHFNRYLDKRKDFKHFILEHYSPDRVQKQIYNVEKTLHGLFVSEKSHGGTDQERLARYASGLSYETISDFMRNMNPLPIPETMGGTGVPTSAPNKKTIREHITGGKSHAQIVMERRQLQQCFAEQHWWSDLYINAKYGVISGEFTPQKQTIEQQISAGKKPEGLQVPPAPELHTQQTNFTR